MKKINISTKKYPDTYALVDDEDYERVNQYKWGAWKDGKTFYAVRMMPLGSGKRKSIRLHRFILNAQKGHLIDHKDRNGLNCQKSNLRFATNSQNQHNQDVFSNNRSGYKGVSWNKRDKKWKASIWEGGRQHYLGYFSNKEDAAQAYNNAAIIYHGNFAYLNILKYS